MGRRAGHDPCYLFVGEALAVVVGGIQRLPEALIFGDRRLECGRALIPTRRKGLTLDRNVRVDEDNAGQPVVDPLAGLSDRDAE